MKPRTIAIVSNEMTPYRLRQTELIHDGLEGVRVLNIFTHAVQGKSMPWKMPIRPDLHILFDEPNRLDSTGQFANRRSLALFRSIRDTITREGVGMVVLLGYNDLPRLLLIRFLKKAGIPVLVMGDSNVFGDARTQGLKRVVKMCFMRWLLGTIDGLMPAGTCGRAFFRNYKDHDLPEFVVPFVANFEALAQRDEAGVAAFCGRFGLRAGRRRLMYSGRFASVKRVDVLLKAFIAIAPERPEWDLVLAGDGPLRAELEAMIPASLRERVTFTGFLQFEDVCSCYHSCDALVLPSDYEPWALVVSEAMAAGLAVVTTDVVGAAIDLVRPGENGFLVTPRSVPSLEKALRQLTSPGVIDEMKAASPRVLAAWRKWADPAESMRAAVDHFIPRK